MTKVVLIVLGVLIFTGLGSVMYLSHLQQTGIRLETQLSAQYMDNQNEMSAFRTSFYEQAGLADIKTDKMDKVLTDAIAGRYGDGADMNGALVNAVAEAYPDLKEMDIYDKVIDHVQSGRTAFKEKQSKLLDMLANYAAWRDQGLIRPAVIKSLGFPSSNLQARFNGEILTGHKAVEKMSTVILLNEVGSIYASGEDQALIGGPKNDTRK